MFRFRIIKDIFWKPLWGLLGLLWAITGHLLNSLSLFGIDVEYARGIIMSYPLVNYIITNWWIITVIIFALAIAEGMYKKAYPYLGDNIKADIEVELYPRHQEGYASIKVHNNEHEDILEPTLSYLKFDISRHKYVPCLQQYNGGNANISRWLGGEEAKIDAKNYIVFNLAKKKDHNFILLFDDGTESDAISGFYQVEVMLDGRIGKDRKKIARKHKTFYIEYWTDIIERGSLKDIKKFVYLDIRENPKRSPNTLPCILLDLTETEERRYLEEKGKNNE